MPFLLPNQQCQSTEGTLPTRWRRKTATIDVKQNHVTVAPYVLCSEDSQRRQRVSHSRRDTVVRQVQVAEEMYESVRDYADLHGRRLQPVATQVLPTQQPDGVRQPQGAPAVRSLQQSAVR